MLVGWLPLSHCPSEACEPQGLDVDMCLRVQAGLTPATETERAHQTTGKTRRKTHQVCGRCGVAPLILALECPRDPRQGVLWTEFHIRATPETGLSPLKY